MLASQRDPAAQEARSSTADPGLIDRRIKQSEPRQPKREPEFRRPPSLAPELPEEAPAGFVLSAVTFQGASVFAPEDFAPLYAEYLARRIADQEIEQILNRITEQYRAAGYILSRAIAPPQQIVAGVLHVEVIEGYVDAVAIEGAGLEREDLARYTDKIMADRPLSLDTLERYVLLINDLAGMTVEPSLRPIDEAEGRYELILAMDYDPADGIVYTDNRGTPAVGRLQGWISGGLNSVLGMGERIQGGFFTVPNQPEELLYFEGLYQQPLGSEGTAFSILGSRSDVDAGDDLARSDTESTSYVVTLQLWHPLIRSRDQNFWVTGSFDFRNLEEEEFGATTVDDRLRVLRARLNYSLADSLDGTTYVTVETSVGLDAFGASKAGSSKLSRFDGDAEFAKVYTTLTREQSLPWHLGLQIDLAAQKASSALLSSEEFAIGGSRFGRAYDFAELTGDDGLAGSVELRYGRELNEDWLQAFQIYSFYDFASVWNQLVDGSSVRDSLSSAGAGIRLLVLPNLRLTGEMAKPLNRRVESTGDQDLRFFFSATASF